MLTSEGYGQGRLHRYPIRTPHPADIHLTPEMDIPIGLDGKASRAEGAVSAASSRRRWRERRAKAAPRSERSRIITRYTRRACNILQETLWIV